MIVDDIEHASVVQLRTTPAPTAWHWWRTTSLSGLRLVRDLDGISARRCLLLSVVSDNDTELTSVAVLRWSEDRAVAWH